MKQDLPRETYCVNFQVGVLGSLSTIFHVPPFGWGRLENKGRRLFYEKSGKNKPHSQELYRARASRHLINFTHTR